MVLKLTRKQYTDLFGPTKGDKIRLGDTDLMIEVEKASLVEEKQLGMVLPRPLVLLMRTALWIL